MDGYTEKHVLSLLELNSIVSETIATTLDMEFWVETELSEVRQVKGHCYMQLVQKDVAGNTPIATASAKCWKNRWSFISANFERVTHRSFTAGMKVLLKVKADFHPTYGFSWIVSDVDPTFTLGDMARKRMEIVAKLKENGVFDLQKELAIPMFANRIAVVSSANAAGYGDFCSQLSNNEYGFSFRIELFTAIMQGERVEESVIAALNEIYARSAEFDVVVIIRGGGATSDLSGFDTLALAENVANFPLPIITGIGHERDESVLDMVAHTSVKTPTAAAALLIKNLLDTRSVVDEMAYRLYDAANRQVAVERTHVEHLSQKLPLLTSLLHSSQKAMLERVSSRMSVSMGSRFAFERHRLELMFEKLVKSSMLKLSNERNALAIMDNRLKCCDPKSLMRRGYSMTVKDGKIVTDASQIADGDDITTILNNGLIKSKVYETSK